MFKIISKKEFKKLQNLSFCSEIEKISVFCMTNNINFEIQYSAHKEKNLIGFFYSNDLQQYLFYKVVIKENFLFILQEEFLKAKQQRLEALNKKTKDMNKEIKEFKKTILKI